MDKNRPFANLYYFRVNAFEDEKVLVKPIRSYYDVLLERHVSVWTEPFQVDEARARELVRKKLVRVI